MQGVVEEHKGDRPIPAAAKVKLTVQGDTITRVKGGAADPGPDPMIEGVGSLEADLVEGGTREGVAVRTVGGVAL